MQDIFGLVSVVLAVVSLLPYLISTLRGKTRPHIFTWLLWTSLSVSAWLIQYTEGAGAGAWATAVSGLFCVAILLASFKNGHKEHTRSDWICLIVGLSAMPIWLITENAALSIIIVTGIDALGFIPTIRKSWNRPHDELAFTHIMSLVKHIFALLALAQVNMGTALFPGVLALMNVILIGVIIGRRYIHLR